MFKYYDPIINDIIGSSATINNSLRLYSVFPFFNEFVAKSMQNDKIIKFEKQNKIWE